MKKIDLIGQRFGRLVVVSGAGTRRNKTGHTYRVWKCQCSCGKEIFRTTTDLTSGKVRSCGCYQKDCLRERVRIHGLSHTRIYDIYQKMLERCYNTNTTYYKNYGGRGIKVCDEWKKDIKTFIDWSIKSGYKDNLTIERKDNDGDYCPENCTWITQAEQNRNRRTSHFVTFKGKRMVLAELARETGIAPQTIKKYEEQYNFNYDLMVKKILESPYHELGKRGKKTWQKEHH